MVTHGTLVYVPGTARTGVSSAVRHGGTEEGWGLVDEFVERRGYRRAVSILYQYEIQTGSVQERKEG